MPIPDYQTLMLPVLRLAAEGERRVGEVAEVVADQFGLGADERAEMLPSGRQRVLHNRIHWAKFYMAKAGLVAAPARGRFVATEAGRRVLAGNPARIDTTFLLREPAFRAFYRNEGPAEAAPPDDRGAPPTEAVVAPRETPQDRIEAAHQEIQAALREELLQRIGQNSPTFFEGLIVDLLVAMGYGGGHRNAAAHLGRSGDGGIDGVIDADRLGLDRVYVQAKRYGAITVGRPEVQGFVGSLVGLGASKGVFVTTSTFTAQAREFVRHLTQRVILLDGPTLADLMIEHGVGVRTVQTVALKRLDEDFFAEDD